MRMGGDIDGAAVTARSAETFARANGLLSALYTARVHRTAGIRMKPLTQNRPRLMSWTPQSLRSRHRSRARARPQRPN